MLGPQNVAKCDWESQHLLSFQRHRDGSQKQVPVLGTPDALQCAVFSVPGLASLWTTFCWEVSFIPGKYTLNSESILSTQAFPEYLNEISHMTSRRVLHFKLYTIYFNTLIIILSKFVSNQTRKACSGIQNLPSVHERQHQFCIPDGSHFQTSIRKQIPMFFHLQSVLYLVEKNICLHANFI